MGQTSSRESGSTKVFLPEAPTQFSSKLSESLQSNPETDYTLSQYKAKYIEDQVAERLYKAREDAEAELKTATQKVGEIDESRFTGTDSQLLQQRLSELQKSLAGRPKKGQLDSTALHARDVLVQCIQANKDKILNCRAELDNFQEVVRSTEASLGL